MDPTAYKSSSIPNSLSIDNTSAPNTAEECIKRFNQTSGGCQAAWDDLLCWPPASPGQIVSISCSKVLQIMEVPLSDTTKEKLTSEYHAYRICSETGEWLWGNWTNYTQCLSLLAPDPPSSVPTAVVVGYILFICSSISILLMSASVFVFLYFKSLECPRLQVHRNLMMALIVHSLSLLLISSPIVVGNGMGDYIQVEWLCKLILCIKMYSSLASINWMFIEGLMLHGRVTTKIFEQKFPFKVYYLIGWGIPSVIIGIWAYQVSSVLSTRCWEGYGDQHYVWIIIAPMMLALLINCAFLINIIRVLTLKLKRNNTNQSNTNTAVDTTKFKAIKATLLLFPLLGTTHLLFVINPKDSRFEIYYMITNAILQSSQGIFVSILYCFMNDDVQRVVRNCYLRANVRRGMTTSGSSIAGGTITRRMRGSTIRKSGVENCAAVKTALLNGSTKSTTRKFNSFHGSHVDQDRSFQNHLPSRHTTTGDGGEPSSEMKEAVHVTKSCCVSICDVHIKTVLIRDHRGILDSDALDHLKQDATV